MRYIRVDKSKFQIGDIVIFNYDRTGSDMECVITEIVWNGKTKCHYYTVVYYTRDAHIDDEYTNFYWRDKVVTEDEIELSEDKIK